MKNQQTGIFDALEWINKPRSASLRGRRITAWWIAIRGPATIDGSGSIEEAGLRRGVGRSALFEMLRVLRTRYGLVPPEGSLRFTELARDKPHKKPFAESPDDVIGFNGVSETEESDWNFPMTG